MSQHCEIYNEFNRKTSKNYLCSHDYIYIYMYIFKFQRIRYKYISKNQRNILCTPIHFQWVCFPCGIRNVVDLLVLRYVLHNVLIKLRIVRFVTRGNKSPNPLIFRDEWMYVVASLSHLWGRKGSILRLSQRCNCLN